MIVTSEEYVEDTTEAVISWLSDQVDAMRHPDAKGGLFLAGYLAAQEQVYSMLSRLEDAIEGAS